MDKTIYDWINYASEEKKQESFNKLEEIYKKEIISLSEDFIKEIKESLDNKTPIFIVIPTKSDINPIKNKIKNKFKKENLNKVNIDIFENLDKYYVEGMSLITYKDDFIYINPLLDEIINEIKKYEHSNSLIYVVSPSKMYSKSIRKEIEKRINHEQVVNILVGTWKEVKNVSINHNQ